MGVQKLTRVFGKRADTTNPSTPAKKKREPNFEILVVKKHQGDEKLNKIQGTCPLHFIRYRITPPTMIKTHFKPLLID